MLSRVADSLYWMGRYIERAENVSRLIDVQLDLLLDLHPLPEDEIRRQFESIISAMGEEETWVESGLPLQSIDVVNFFTQHPSNPNSIANCIRGARENARCVREQISTEMWEQLNRLYLSTRNVMPLQNQFDFFKTIKEGAQMFHGITDATMSHTEGWEFIRVGKFLERADKTSRLVEVRHQLLEPGHPSPSHPTDVMEWMAVLKSCSALEAYRKIYSTTVEPSKVVAFLLLDESFPRSVRFGISEVVEALRNISPSAHSRFVNSAQKAAFRMRADFDFCELSDVFNLGLHDFLDDLQMKLNQLGTEIRQCYLTHTQLSQPGTEWIIQQQQ